MKLLSRSLSLLTLASLVLFFANCGGSEGGGSNKEKKQFNKLKETWTLTGATLDGVSQMDKFDDFTLTIGGTYDSDSPEGPYTYNTSGTDPDPSPWPGSGNWVFDSIGSDEVLIVRDPGTLDEINMSYHFDGNNLVMSLTVPENSPGWRTAVVSGDWVFTFSPAPGN